MYTKPALGFLFAFLGLIALAYIGLQILLDGLAADTLTMTLAGIALACMIGGGIVVASEEMKEAH